MIYPFVPNQQFPQAAQKLREALASFPAFRVRLRELSFFKHQSRSWTVWLKPETEPEGALVRLQGELERVFPHCNDQSQIGEHGFTPHLSVANDFRKAVRHPSLSFVLFRFRSFFPSPRRSFSRLCTSRGRSRRRWSSGRRSGRRSSSM